MRDEPCGAKAVENEVSSTRALVSGLLSPVDARAWCVGFFLGLISPRRREEEQGSWHEAQPVDLPSVVLCDLCG
jgi:hypothetical protein